MTQANISISVNKLSNTTSILNIKGEINAFAEDSLMSAYNEATSNGAVNIILNFSELEYMNSSGIGLLVTMLIRVQRQKQNLLAYGLTDHYRQIFELTRLNEAITIYPTEAEALQATKAAVAG
jgi:anti-sigma B factor antagonist